MTYPYPSCLYWPGLQDTSIEVGMPVTASLVDRDYQSAVTLGTVRNVEVDDDVGRWVLGKVF